MSRQFGWRIWLPSSSKNKSEFFTGFLGGDPVHLAFSEGQSSPSVFSQPCKPSLRFHLFENCTRKNHPSAILYPNQVKWKLHEETYPSVIPQLSSGWNLLHCASCPLPLPGSLWEWSMGGEGGSGLREGNCFCGSIGRNTNLFILERELSSHTTAADRRRKGVQLLNWM